MSENLFKRLQQANNKRSYPQTSSGAATSTDTTSDANSKSQGVNKRPKISRGGVKSRLASHLGTKSDEQATTEDQNEEEEGEYSEEASNDVGDDANAENEDYDDDYGDEGAEDDAEGGEQDYEEDAEGTDEQTEGEVSESTDAEDKAPQRPVVETRADNQEQKLQIKSERD